MHKNSSSKGRMETNGQTDDPG